MLYVSDNFSFICKHSVTVTQFFFQKRLRVHQRCTETEVNDAIIDFLKHAPHQPGGNKYKVLQLFNKLAAEP